MPNLQTAQHWLGRNRPPRVQITYDVQDNGAMVKEELPFVVGVLADLQGHADPNSPTKPFRDRKFTLIDQDSFDDVFAKIGPQLVLDLSKANPPETGAWGPVTLKFTAMKDFEPSAIAKQVKPINDLLEERKKLVELLARLAVNPVLSTKLGNLLAVPVQRQALETDVAPPPPAGPAPSPPPAPAPGPAPAPDSPK
jgi:type VI secretion system protein ImpB